MTTKQTVLRKFPKAIVRREIGKFSGKVFYAVYSSKEHTLLIETGNTIDKAWEKASIKIETEYLILNDLMV